MPEHLEGALLPGQPPSRLCRHLPGLQLSIRPSRASRLRPSHVWHPGSLRPTQGSWSDEVEAALAPTDCESRSRESQFAKTESPNAASRDRDFAFAEADPATGCANGTDSTAISTGTDAEATHGVALKSDGSCERAYRSERSTASASVMGSAPRSPTPELNLQRCASRGRQLQVVHRDFGCSFATPWEH